VVYSAHRQLRGPNITARTWLSIRALKFGWQWLHRGRYDNNCGCKWCRHDRVSKRSARSWELSPSTSISQTVLVTDIAVAMTEAFRHDRGEVLARISHPTAERTA